MTFEHWDTIQSMIGHKRLGSETTERLFNLCTALLKLNMASVPISLCKIRTDLLIYKNRDDLSVLKAALVTGSQATIDFILKLPDETLRLVTKDDKSETILHIAARNQ